MNFRLGLGFSLFKNLKYKIILLVRSKWAVPRMESETRLEPTSSRPVRSDFNPYGQFMIPLHTLERYNNNYSQHRKKSVRIQLSLRSLREELEVLKIKHFPILFNYFNLKGASIKI